jgi:hypothetical protein
MLCTHISVALHSLRGRKVLQLELGHLRFMEIIPELKAVLGQSDSSRPRDSRLFIITADDLDVLG